MLLVLLAAASEVLVDRPVPMRDGVVLRADLRLPPGTGHVPFPTLVYRTPYGKHRAATGETIFERAVERGYAVVIQDVRGRYASDGEFEQYRNEVRDGFDTIAWAAAQPWSNGEVGTFGLSYPGAVQWLAALESPPALKAMVPAMTYSTPENFFYSGGVFDLSWVPWIWNNIAPDVRRRRNLPGPRDERAARETWQKGGAAMRARLPLDALAEFRDIAPYYFEWLAHPPGDPWWDWAEIRGRYAATSAAVLNVSGWHDEAYGPEGAVTNFLGLLEARRGATDPRAELVLGPWVHGGTGDTNSGERGFGAAASLDYAGLVLDFLDRHLRGRTLEAPPRVRAFVMGENAWRAGETWPLPGTRERELRLSAPEGRGAGRLVGVPEAKPGTRCFVSNPRAPVTDPHAAAPGAHDYRDLAKRADVAVFQTEPLAEDLTVVGAIRAAIWISADAPDVDLWLKVQDVTPDGTAWNLMSPGLDVLRASYRDGGAEKKLLKSGEAVALRYERLLSGNRFLRGHRLRVVLSPSFAPHFSRNLQTGESEVRSRHLRPARITVHFDPERPSRIVLPVVPPP